MYKTIILLLIISTNLTAQYSLYDTSYLHEIKISSSNPDFWQQLDDDFQNWLSNGVEIPYLSATVEVDGNVLTEVGVRQKGFSSNFLVSTTKKPLKLNFGIFSSDGKRTFDGVRKVNLMNGVGDAAIAKDKMAYDIFRMHGVPAPRVAHAKVYVNDVFWGVYAMIEQIDKKYLKRNFADNDGNLWKNKGNSDLVWTGPNQADYPFELQTNEVANDWTKFFNFVDFINNSSNADFESSLKNIFEVDEYFRILAIDILTNNWDSYLDHGRNWYIYHEPKANKIHWIPWDYNFAFDRFPSGAGDLSLIQDNPLKILTRRVFEIPTFKTRILNYMCEILEVNFTASRIHPILDGQLNLVLNDWGASNDFFTTTDLTEFIDGDTWNGSFSGAGSQGMKKFVTDRRIVIQNALATEGHICTGLSAAINPQDVVINEFMAQNDTGSPWFDQDGEFDDWIELYNNTASPISLKNYFLSDTDTFIHKWELPEDTVIPANGYLIVWADKDPQQIGLHSKFSLSKNGEKIFLSYLDGTLIDSVEFGAQAKNESMSRIPNGTGIFVNTDVTFNTENTNINSDVLFENSFE
ncbi:MAG: CotH kinase family protein [Proteobacteria bacterium]|nr:CotH kinase family protein [Pseudomonadota bacterium]